MFWNLEGNDGAIAVYGEALWIDSKLAFPDVPSGFHATQTLIEAVMRHTLAAGSIWRKV
jgi:hypothetical protein